MPDAVQAAAPQWAEVATGVLAIVQAVAIVVGGTWAYFKFLRGRTFSKRLELSVAGTHVHDEQRGAIVIEASMRNAGLAVVHLSEVVKVVYLYGLRASEWIPGEDPDWGDHLMIVAVFDNHKWIEAQETVMDQVLATVPVDSDGPDPWLVFRLVLIVGSKRRRLRKSLKWTATAVVPTALRSNGDERPRKESVLP